jgi:vesicle-fusing ATPase
MNRWVTSRRKATSALLLWLFHFLILPTRSLSTKSSFKKSTDTPPQSSSISEEETRISAWEVLGGNIANCLIQSDLKRDSGFDGSSTGWTSWVEESSAFRLQQCINQLVYNESNDSVRWNRWMKSSPNAMILECSAQLQTSVNAHLTEESLTLIGQTREEVLARMACQILVLPSGSTLQQPLRAAPGGMIYGLLLYGGVTRFRILGKTRKAGERTVIASEKSLSWLQYGGPERSYQAVDMGPCALMEIILLPKGLEVVEEKSSDMVIQTNQQFPLAVQFQFRDEAEVKRNTSLTTTQQPSPYVNYQSEFQSVLGGLTPQIQAIVRRVLEGRATTNNDSSSNDTIELQDILDLGLHPVKGILLFGPPGCGKTALARELSRLLTERPPKICSAPELLDKWIGGSEKLVRDLFADAEAELRVCNGDLTKSGLHVIVIDEIDAVFRKRSSSSDSGEVTRASAVNQVLSKLDGVNTLGNILVIGTTNRKELLDDALIRPGRLEVQVEIPLPDVIGRQEILQIHFQALRRNGRLSSPLLQSLDSGSLAKKLPKFSGADIQGLVRCAGSLALARARNDGSGMDGLIVTLQDVMNSFSEMKP